MREESHLDDMRAAIRGDFERLARRRGTQELMQEPDEAPEPAPDPEPERPADREPEAREPAVEENDVPRDTPAVEERAPRRGVFARLFGL